MDTISTNRAVPSVGLAMFSVCASVTRGHRRIASHVRKAGLMADLRYVQPLPWSSADETLVGLRGMVKSGLYDRVVLVLDFPDVPLTPEFHQALLELRRDRCPVLTVYLSMVTSQYYRELYSIADQVAHPYDVVVAVEPGACRHVTEHPKESARCRDADFKIAPLIVDLPPLTHDEIVIWDNVTQGITEPVLWLQSGDPHEESQLHDWLHRSLGSRLIASRKLENYQRALSSEVALPVVRFATIAPRIISAAGYSTFWELYALGCSHKVVRWLDLKRVIEDIEGRLRLLSKPDLLAGSSPGLLRTTHSAGVLALAEVFRSITTMKV